MTFKTSLIATTIALTMATAASAVTVVSTSQINAGYVVSNSDLLQTNLASTSSVGSFSREGEAGLPALVDGGFGPLGGVITNGAGLAAATADATNSITYTLDGAYNLTLINTYAGWDQYRGGQSYTVFYATASAPTTFVSLASVFNNTTGAASTDFVNTGTSIFDPAGFLATNVVALRFDFGGDLQFGYAGYREIDVFGTSAATVPEPAVWGMMLIGFGLVGVSARRRGTAIRTA